MQQILEILSSVGFNWHVALANFVNFLIILFLLNKFFFSKLGKVIDERHEVIERGLSQASDAEKKLAQAHDEGKAVVAQAKKDGHALVVAAEEQAKSLASEIEDKAQKEADARLQALTKKEAALAVSVEREFREKAPHIVAELYKKTIEENLTEDDNNARISRTK